MNYTANYFRENLPDWKKRKDPLICRCIYRPISFQWSSFCANHNITANAVSYFSALLAVIGAMLFLVDSYPFKVCGAVIINIWPILDCVDGNLARCVRKQPFGEFADAISSYILMAFLGTCMGFSVFQEGGVFVSKGCVSMILMGAFGSTGDTLMRLVYQKYKATARELIDEGIIQGFEDKRTEHSQVESLSVKIDQALGIGGWLPLLILFSTLLRCIDVVVVYCFIYYLGSCVVVTLQHIRKAMSYDDRE